MNYKLITFLCVGNFIFCNAVSFDESMQAELFEWVIKSHPFYQSAYNMFSQMYASLSPDVMPKKDTLKIPKIIHHVWLGSKLPEEYIALRKTWISNHPDWMFIFWTDNILNYDQGQVITNSFDQLEEYLDIPLSKSNLVVMDVKHLVFDNRAFYDEALNYGEKSDILKWEIVYRYGGLYVDTDFECLKPLDILHYMYDFYTGIQPLDTNAVQLGAALYAAYPEHEILRRCVEGIKENQLIEQIIFKTGPIHFTQSFFTSLPLWKIEDCNIALPSSYFYPCGYEQKGLPASVWQKPESYAVHHWAGSWLRPEAFVR